MILAVLGVFSVLTWAISAQPIVTIPPDHSPFVVPGVTIAATIFTAIVRGRIQQGFIRSLETQLRGEINEKLDIKFRGVLGIDSFEERFTKGRNFMYFAIYSICGLLTAVIVSTFTPNCWC